MDLIEQLEELLIHYLPTKRELGVEILTQVIEKLDDGDLTSEQLNVIALFYTEKIKDNHQVLPSAIRGILALVQFKNLPESSTAEMLNSIFLNVPCQQQQYDERKNIYQICQISFERRKQGGFYSFFFVLDLLFSFLEMIEMGADFVFGVMCAMEGERDPRNLMLLFNWLPQFFKAINFVHFNEDMFETIACYFPVDFMPMPEKKNVYRFCWCVWNDENYSFLFVDDNARNACGRFVPLFDGSAILWRVLHAFGYGETRFVFKKRKIRFVESFGK